MSGGSSSDTGEAKFYAAAMYQRPRDRASLSRDGRADGLLLIFLKSCFRSSLTGLPCPACCRSSARIPSGEHAQRTRPFPAPLFSSAVARMNRSKLEILAYEDTQLGPLCLRRRELLSDPGTVVTEVTLNHEFLMSSYNTDSERAISNRAIEIHGGNDLTALVGGLGLGYTARELLCHARVATVEVVELLPAVIDWLRGGLVPLSNELNASAGLKITAGDIYQQLLGEPRVRFDLIVIDVDHSPSDQLGEADHAFYTREGLSKAKLHLRDGGILAVWSYAENSSFSDALHSTFRQVQVEPIKTTNDLVGQQQTDWLFFGTRDH